jgi:hypothetical protein
MPGLAENTRHQHQGVNLQLLAFAATQLGRNSRVPRCIFVTFSVAGVGNLGAQFAPFTGATAAAKPYVAVVAVDAKLRQLRDRLLIAFKLKAATGDVWPDSRSRAASCMNSSVYVARDKPTLHHRLQKSIFNYLAWMNRPQFACTFDESRECPRVSESVPPG